MYTLFRIEKLHIWIHRPYAVPFHAIHYAYKTFFISYAYRTSKIILYILRKWVECSNLKDRLYIGIQKQQYI